MKLGNSLKRKVRKFKLRGKQKAVNLHNLKKQRRDTIYKMLGKRNDGKVPCFVCEGHVKPEDATLEHILPTSLGGKEDMSNYSISHDLCNHLRGNDVDAKYVD